MSEERAALFRVAHLLQDAMCGKVAPVEAAWRILEFRFTLPQGAENEAFLPFVGIGSESDTMLVGDRSPWSDDYLRDMDRRRKDDGERLVRSGWFMDYCVALKAVIDAWTHECPVCAFIVPGEPPYDANGEPSYETCAACGFEFGITDDVDGTSFHAWRRDWILAGMPFRLPPAPPEWNPEAQLQGAKLTDRQRR